MKKNYTKPVVEKLEFNYSVVATTSPASTTCSGQETYVWYGSDCHGQPTGGVADLNVG